MTICLVGCGIQSPTGTNAPMSVSTIKGGVSRIIRCKAIEDKYFNPVRLGMSEYLDEELPNLERFVELANSAFEEAIQPLLTVQPPVAGIPVFVGLPKERPGLEADIETEIVAGLTAVAAENNVGYRFSAIREDHDSGLIALKRVAEVFREGEKEFCVVGGVESFISQETVDWLEKQKRLKCSTNRFGYVPGEAASFCLLCSRQTAEKYDLPVHATILGFASAREEHLPGAKTASTGAALTKVIKTALEPLPEGEMIGEILCTLKNVRHETDEFAYSNLAIGPQLQNIGEYQSLVPRWGDIGAASAPTLISYVAEKRRLGFTQPGYTLVFTLSPEGFRSAALLQTL